MTELVLGLFLGFLIAYAAIRIPEVVAKSMPEPPPTPIADPLAFYTVPSAHVELSHGPASHDPASPGATYSPTYTGPLEAAYEAAYEEAHYVASDDDDARRQALRQVLEARRDD